MQKNRYVFFLIIAVAVLPLVVFSFFKKTKGVDGSACKYEISSFPAKVIGIEKADSVFFEISFSITMNDKTETLYYSRELGRFASDADIKNFDLKEGYIFSYEQHTRISGTCEPEFFILRLEKYKTK